MSLMDSFLEDLLALSIQNFPPKTVAYFRVALPYQACTGEKLPMDSKLPADSFQEPINISLVNALLDAELESKAPAARVELLKLWQAIIEKAEALQALLSSLPQMKTAWLGDIARLSDDARGQAEQGLASYRQQVAMCLHGNDKTPGLLILLDQLKQAIAPEKNKQSSLQPKISAFMQKYTAEKLDEETNKSLQSVQNALYAAHLVRSANGKRVAKQTEINTSLEEMRSSLEALAQADDDAQQNLTSIHQKVVAAKSEEIDELRQQLALCQTQLRQAQEASQAALGLHQANAEAMLAAENKRFQQTLAAQQREATAKSDALKAAHEESLKAEKERAQQALTTAKTEAKQALDNAMTSAKQELAEQAQAAATTLAEEREQSAAMVAELEAKLETATADNMLLAKENMASKGKVSVTMRRALILDYNSDPDYFKRRRKACLERFPQNSNAAEGKTSASGAFKSQSPEPILSPDMRSALFNSMLEAAQESENEKRPTEALNNYLAAFRHASHSELIQVKKEKKRGLFAMPSKKSDKRDSDEQPKTEKEFVREKIKSILHLYLDSDEHSWNFGASIDLIIKASEILDPIEGLEFFPQDIFGLFEQLLDKMQSSLEKKHKLDSRLTEVAKYFYYWVIDTLAPMCVEEWADFESMEEIKADFKASDLLSDYIVRLDEFFTKVQQEYSSNKQEQQAERVEAAFSETSTKKKRRKKVRAKSKATDDAEHDNAEPEKQPVIERRLSFLSVSQPPTQRQQTQPQPGHQQEGAPLPTVLPPPPPPPPFNLTQKPTEHAEQPQPLQVKQTGDSPERISAVTPTAVDGAQAPALPADASAVLKTPEPQKIQAATVDTSRKGILAQIRAGGPIDGRRNFVSPSKTDKKQRKQAGLFLNAFEGRMDMVTAAQAEIERRRGAVAGSDDENNQSWNDSDDDAAAANDGSDMTSESPTKSLP